MTPTDNILVPETSLIITNTSTDKPQESNQSSSWNGRETTPIEKDSDDQSSQVSMAEKVESTASVSLTEQTTTHNSSINPFQNMQIALLPGFEGIQATFSLIVKSLQDGLSSVVTAIPFVADRNHKIEIDSELERIRSLPGSLQDVITSYIDPTEKILGMIKNGEDIPDYLIHHARHVTILDLEDQYMTYEQLIKMLSYFKNLEFLDLPRHKFSSDNIPFYQNRNDFANALSNLKKLQHLNLTSWAQSTTNEMTDEMTDEIIERIIDKKPLRYLNFDYCNKLTVKTFSNIANSQVLEGLSLNFCDIDDASFSEILKIKTLKELQLRRNEKLTTDQLKQLNEIPNLKILHIKDMNNVTDEVAEVISECRNIETLDVSFCKKITNKALESFTKLSCLKILYLRCCDQIDDNGLHSISNLTGLKALVLIGCKSISEKFLSILEPHDNLEYLNIASCPKLNNESLKSLFKFKKLKNLIIGKENNTNYFNSVVKNKLTDLEITVW